MDGGDFLFEGRFALWGDTGTGRMRGDLCGPDGLPVLSWSIDSTGAVFSMPRDEAAFFHPGGVSFGSFSLSAGNLLFLVRTGFPVQMEAWQIAEGASVGSRVRWEFVDARTGEVLVELNRGAVFPSALTWSGGSASILSASMHDEYRAWPSSWRFETEGLTAVVEIRSFDTDPEPWPGLWDLGVPFPVDTIQPVDPLEPVWTPSRR